MSNHKPLPSHKNNYDRELTEMVDRLKPRLPCCPNCTWWRAEAELCTWQNQNIRPPAPVIAFGCAAFEYEIPF